MFNEDYKEMLQSLLGKKVKFLVVGAYALGAHGYPRATGDFDIWVETSAGNSKKIYAALAEFGTPLSGLRQDSFTKPGIVLQIGVAPRRIDIITHIDGVDFADAYKTKKMIEIEGLKTPFISKKNLIKNKQSTGRAKDKIDVGYLKKH